MKIISILICVILLGMFIGCDERTEVIPDSPGVIIVLNKSDDTANLINRATGETIAVVETGYQPHEVAISPDGRLAVVTNYGLGNIPGNSLTIIDLMDAHSVKEIDLGEYTFPHGIQWLNDDQRVIVTAEGKQAVLIVNIETGDIERVVTTGQRVSHMVAVTPDYRKAFIPNIGSGNTTVIDMETFEVITHIETGAGAEGIDISPDSREVWVTNRAANTVSVIDVEKLEVIAELESADFPIRAKFTPDGRYVLVSNARSGDVAVFDASDKSEVARVRMDAEIADDKVDRYFADQFEGSPIPIGLIVPPDGRTAYVANSNADVVVVIDLETLEVVARFETGTQPDGIGWSAVVPF